jgi:hypothetical protein
MTYVTGQPIIFVGCGQVWISSSSGSQTFIFLCIDIYRFKTAEGCKCCPSYSQRLMQDDIQWHIYFLYLIHVKIHKGRGDESTGNVDIVSPRRFEH